MSVGYVLLVSVLCAFSILLLCQHLRAICYYFVYRRVLHINSRTPAPPRPQSYPQVLHITAHRLRMLYISYTQVIHAAWSGSACHTPVAISGTCGTFGLPVWTLVYFGQVWGCMRVAFGHTWAWHKHIVVAHKPYAYDCQRHKLTLAYSSSTSTCR